MKLRALVARPRNWNGPGAGEIGLARPVVLVPGATGGNDHGHRGTTGQIVFETTSSSMSK
jgi:hypothetical protein